MLKYLIILFWVITLHYQLQAYQFDAKREFRGAWIATVINLDWPSSRDLPTQLQKDELIEIFNELENSNINVVFFQVRSEADAFYESQFEPWSYWLTGMQGKSPEPFYDPLVFAIEEAHKRGIELHAWFNPFRVERDANNYITASNHVSNLHPEWVIQIGDIKFLNPGLSEVRDYITTIVMDVVSRYEIDGVHFDDYFYPYPPNQITTQDQQTFIDDPRGFFNIGDWRRDNINELIRSVYNSIQDLNPEIKFGISPFGIWKNGIPSGIVGMDAYNVIFSDPLTWLNEEKVDYIAPQLYWPFGGQQDYGKLLPWWAQQMNGRHLLAGQGLYRAGSWPINEIPNQIELNRSTENCYGSIFFRAGYFFSDPNNAVTNLKQNYYKYKSLVPIMNWKDIISPENPTNLRFDKLLTQRGDGLIWETPNKAIDGDSATKYVVYRFENGTIEQSDLDNPSNISTLTYNNFVTPNLSADFQSQNYFLVTALDDNNNESLGSNVIRVDPVLPEIPVLLYPENAAVNQPDTTILRWSNSLHSSTNRLEVALDPEFNEMFLSKSELVDTFKIIYGMVGEQNYYWRVAADNLFGGSEFSETRMFITGFPIAPNLISPEDKALNVRLQPTLEWNSLETANLYHLQIAEGLSVEPSIIVLDTLVTDTSIVVPIELNPDKIFSWRVRAGNEYGFSLWSEISKFKTENVVSIVDNSELATEFELQQNFPNPFNPETNIKFSIPQSNYTTLMIYDVLGRLIGVLIDEQLNRGTYVYNFNASNFASGIYIYVLKSGNNIISKKMILLK